MTATDLIRLATELAECGGVHRFNNLVAAASHVLLEHERARTVEAWEDGPEVGVGMSDKVARERSMREEPGEFDALMASRYAASRAPERNEASGRPDDAPEGRGALAGFHAPLVTCPRCLATGVAFICSRPGCPVNGGAAHPEPGLLGGPPGYPCQRPSQVNVANPTPIMPERGERKPLPQSDCQGEYPSGGIIHDPGSPLLALAQDDFGRRKVPKFDGKRTNPEDLGDGA